MATSEVRCCIGPCSQAFHQSGRDFHTLSRAEKTAAVGGAIFFGLLTSFAGGVGGFWFFTAFVEKRKIKKLAEIDGTPLLEAAGKVHFLEERQLLLRQETGLLTPSFDQDEKTSLIEEKHLLTDEETALLTPSTQTAVSLVTHYSKFWDDFSLSYEGIPLDLEFADETFLESFDRFGKNIESSEHFGFVQKLDLKKGSTLFVRADLHGDLRSLLMNLSALQKEGFLDQELHCKEGFAMVFLGDFADRGKNGLEVLLLLATLRLENPESVILVRGNHEDVSMNAHYLHLDPNLNSYLQRDQSREGIEILTAFYESMPISLYVSEQIDLIEDPLGRRDYVQLTHGAFELTFDPSDLLSSISQSSFAWVPKTRDLPSTMNDLIRSRHEKDSALFQEIDSEDPAKRKSAKLHLAARRISMLAERIMPQSGKDNAFQWGDLADETYLGDVSRREWRISGEDIRWCFKYFGRGHKLSFLIRGHQHQWRHHFSTKGLIATTLPVGMESIYASIFPEQVDASYLLQTASKVKDWKKRALMREPGIPMTNLSETYPMLDRAI